MKAINLTEVRKNIYKLIEQVNETHEPIQIIGNNHNAILISEENWPSIQETLHLVSIPGMRASIIEGLNTPLSETSDKLNW